MIPDYDSILTAQDTNLINTSQYYKVGKGLPDNGIPMVEQSYVVAKDDILIGGIIFLFFIMSVVMYRSRVSIFFRLKDFFSGKRSYSDENVNENDNDALSQFFLTSISALMLSLMFFDYMAVREGFPVGLGVPYWLFAAAYVVVMTFIYAKAWLYSLVNWVFFDKETGVKWQAGYMLLTALSAFVTCPLSLIVVLEENMRGIVTWGFVFAFVLYEFLLFFKMFVNFESKKYGYLLIILYFCSVELIPAVVMSRITMWAMDSFIVKNLLY